MSKYINKLPAILQTSTQRKFFDATVDQMFSKKDSKRFDGYIGRKDNILYNASDDFYLPELNKDRANYQLEPVVMSYDTGTQIESNHMFYTDIVNRMKFYGSNTTNHDRLFSTEYYSYSPPINIDMFVNYYNYVWVSSKFNPVEIKGYTTEFIESNVIGQTNVTIGDVEITDGMRIAFPLTQYNEAHTVQYTSNGIRLIPDESEVLKSPYYVALPWDIDTPVYGDLLENSKWDVSTWAVTDRSAALPDYVTIEKGSANKNSWSRSNKWYHVQSVYDTIKHTGDAFPAAAIPASRPIIEFEQNLELFNTGTKYASDINEMFTGGAYTYAAINGKLHSLLVVPEGLLVSDSYTIAPGAKAIFNSSDVTPYGIMMSETIWTIVTSPTDGTISLVPGGYIPLTYAPVLNIGKAYFAENTQTRTLSTMYEGVELPIGSTFAFRAASGKTLTIAPPAGATIDSSASSVTVTSANDTVFTYAGGNNWTTSTISELQYVAKESDTAFASTGDYTGSLMTFSEELKTWIEPAANQKYVQNQPPMFELYDTNRVKLSTLAPDTFNGSPIFGYKQNTYSSAPVDRYLNMRLVYKSDALTSNIVFENNIHSDEYRASDNSIITGYKYYRTVREYDSIDNAHQWNLNNTWYKSDKPSKQWLNHHFIVSDVVPTEYTIRAVPHNNSTDHVVVTINGRSASDYTFVSTNGTTTVTILDDLKHNDSVFIKVYTTDPIVDNTNGYFEIPQQLDANPLNEEVNDFAFSDFVPHFNSAIANQDGASQNPAAIDNNYRNSQKLHGRGTQVLQNEASCVRSSYLLSDSDINVVDAIRYVSNEYTNFKDKFVSVANQTVKNKSMHDASSTLLLQRYLNDALQLLSNSRLYSDAFALSYAIALGTEDATQLHNVVSNTIVVSDIDIDIAKPENFMYVYKVTVDANSNYTTQEVLLPYVEYTWNHNTITNTITVTFSGNKVADGDTILVRVYNDPVPVYMPNSPAKLGMTPVYVPELYVDTTYVTERVMILGHDGSRTPAYGKFAMSGSNVVVDSNGMPVPDGLDLNGGTVADVTIDEYVKYADMRDVLLLELEKHIYVNIDASFINDYNGLLSLQELTPGAFRTTKYTSDEFVSVVTPYFAKWAAKTKTNFRENNSFDPSNWKTYNYSMLNGVVWNYNTNSWDTTTNTMPGHWKGIYIKYFDTIRPDTKPWEMLGFSIMPSWWVATTDTGDSFTGYGSNWSNTNTEMWADIEQGLIRRGSRAGYHSTYTRRGLTGSNTLWNTPLMQTLSNGVEVFRSPIALILNSNNIVPVDSSGNIRTIESLFNLSYPWNGVDSQWNFGDYAPAEFAWYNSDEYVFATLELMLLLSPCQFGDYMWDTTGILQINDQLVNASSLTRAISGQTVKVHGEMAVTGPTIVSGYQQYISDHIIKDNKDVSTVFGDQIRNLTAKLGYKVGGFTNADTMRLYINNPSTLSSQSLTIPSDNYRVSLHTGAPISTHSYSGVIVRINENNTYSVYGYDVTSPMFTMYEADISRSSTVTHGGIPASYTAFEFGKLYNEGSIVKHNSAFYRATVTHTASSFTASYWDKLPALPMIGGLSAKYYKHRTNTTRTVHYGDEFESHTGVYDFLIGYGKYLTDNNWVFENVNKYGQVEDWKFVADQFLYWAVNEWEPGNTIMLSPSSTKLKLKIDHGYAGNVERLHNGTYSIVNKYGMSIDPSQTTIDRNGNDITVIPKTNTGVYGLTLSTYETEHIVTVDNETGFSDVIYNPVFRSRQSRLRFVGHKTQNWTGKHEAAGYFVNGNKLVQNIENVTDSFRDFHNTESILDNVQIDEAARNLTGYSNRDYLTNMDINDDIQAGFYKGFIRQKGTANAVNKILRSSTIRDSNAFEQYEDWAVKRGTFAGNARDCMFEYISKFEDISADPQVYRINSKRSEYGFVDSVGIYNSSSVYTSVPDLTVIRHVDDNQMGIDATLEAIVDSNGHLTKINVIEPGTGYKNTPTIIGLNSGDVAYAIIKRAIETQTNAYEIIDIDIDDTDRFVFQSHEVDINKSVPYIKSKSFNMPHAGFVSSNDVKYTVFENIYSMWSRTVPELEQPIWIASNQEKTWDVCKLVRSAATIQSINVVTVPADEENGIEEVSVDLAAFNAAQLNGTFTNNLTQMELATRYPNIMFDTSGNALSGYVALNYEANSDRSTSVALNRIVYFKYDQDNNVFLLFNDADATTFDDALKSTDVATYNKVEYLISLKFKTAQDHTAAKGYTSFAINNSDLVWVGNISDWYVSSFDETVLHRKSEDLINSHLIHGMYLRDPETNDTIASVPVVDPFKGILPGPVRKNVSYIQATDPASYNSDGSQYLSSLYGKRNVGEVWWDTSTLKYMHYEQPIAANETEEDVITYRRSNWGKVFPGSVATVYEWVESYDPPAQYNGEGTPMNTFDYVERAVYNHSIGETEVVYYFWVSGKLTAPNTLINRTMSTTSIASLIEEPTNYAYSSYSIIYSSDTDIAISVMNTSHLLRHRNLVVQVNYDSETDAETTHNEWQVMHENDRFTSVPTDLWDKLVDSYVGYTKPVNSGDNTSILVDNGKYVMPVPDPRLPASLQLGIKTRPRQSMFKDLAAARRNIIGVINSLLRDVHMWEDKYSGWSDLLASNKGWKYSNWYADGYTDRNTKTQIVYREYQLMIDDAHNLNDGDIIKLQGSELSSTNQTAVFSVYRFEKEHTTFKLIKQVNGTVELLPELYTNLNDSELNNNLRMIFNIMKDVFFINGLSTRISNILFASIRYAVSEQADIDWAFKTSYISYVQDGKQLIQTPTVEHDTLSEFLNFVNEAKPYSTKVRNESTLVAYLAPLEIAESTAYDNFLGTIETSHVVNVQEDHSDPENPVYGKVSVTETVSDDFVHLRTMDINNTYDRFGPGYVSYKDNDQWDRYGWDGVVNVSTGDGQSVATNHLWDFDFDTLVSYVPPVGSDEAQVLADADTSIDEMTYTRSFENVHMNINYTLADSTAISYKVHVYQDINTLENVATYTVNADSSYTTVSSTVPDATAGATVPSTIAVTNAAIFNSGGGIAWIENEQITYAGKSGSNLTGVIRGVNKTLPVEHLSGARIYAEDYEIINTRTSFVVGVPSTYENQVTSIVDIDGNNVMIPIGNFWFNTDASGVHARPGNAESDILTNNPGTFN